MDGTSLNLIVIFQYFPCHFPISHPFRSFDVRSPCGGQIGQALARGSRGVLFVAARDVCKDINEAQRARSYLKILGKSWENGGKMVGKMLEICEEFCLGKSLNIDVWDAAHFPTEFCGISSGHLWTRCITCGTMGSGGMVQWTKVTLNSIRSYSFTIVLLCFMLCLTHFPHWNRSIFELLTGYPEEEQLHMAGQKRGNNGLIIFIWGPDVWPFKWGRFVVFGDLTWFSSCCPLWFVNICECFSLKYASRRDITRDRTHSMRTRFHGVVHYFFGRPKQSASQAIVAEHDRSAHAERQALLKVLRQLKNDWNLS